MLVLSRQTGERLLIGDEIIITVVRISPNSVRLGIDAPAHMNVVREEIARRHVPIQAGPEQVCDLGRRMEDES